jgi:hypothetical protein
VRTCCNDSAVFNQQSRVVNYRDVTEFSADARSSRSGKRHKLADVHDGGCTCHAYFPAIGM